MKIFKKEFLKHIGKVLLATFMGFINDNGLKLSASLAFYTVFSIAPLLFLIMALAGIFLGGNQNVTNEIYPHLSSLLGKQAAGEILGMLKNQLTAKSGTAVVIGVVTLLFGASSMFVEIQDSLNIIWRVKAKPKQSWLKFITNRFLSFSLIISLGFLLLVSLIINLLILALSAKLQHFLPGVTIWLLNAINVAISIVVIAVLFGIMFKFLPDVKIAWKDVRSGAIFTALFFLLGKFLIGLYIQYFANSSAYGAAGSVILILLWIYYTAAILYIGAEFTQVYAEAIGSRIEPAEYAVHVRQTEVEVHVNKLPVQHPEIKGELKADPPK
jgi:membrane protein